MKNKTLDENYELILRRKRTPPTWLRGYQERFREAIRVAAERTRHLKGAERVSEMNRLTGIMLRGEEIPPAASFSEPQSPPTVKGGEG